MHERRRHERICAALEIKVTWPGHGGLVGYTVDLSDSGVLVQGSFVPPPPPGTILELQLNRLVNGAEPPVLHGRVVRAGEGIIACEFVLDGP